MLAEIGNISQALINAIAEVDALVQNGVINEEIVELLRHARDLGDLLRDAVERADDQVDDRIRAMATTLASAVESLEKT
jgi:hypothetical protein